jgi:hypothetical protein
MISVITTLKDRAYLLKYGVEGILRQDYWSKNDEQFELVVGDGLSTDNLDEVLQEISKRPEVNKITKYSIDRSKSVYEHRYNCPAEELNILVKKSNSDIIVKIDPEAVLVDADFLSEAVPLAREGSIVTPFPLHCKKFEFSSFEDILNRYKNYSFETHIHKDNCTDTNVYYTCVMNREKVINLGGIDERFISSYGSEDDHFFKQYQRMYGYSSRVTLFKTLLHLYHSELGNGVVPRHLYPAMMQGQQLHRELKDTYPNEGREWGRSNNIVQTKTFINEEVTLI